MPEIKHKSTSLFNDNFKTADLDRTDTIKAIESKRRMRITIIVAVIVVTVIASIVGIVKYKKYKYEKWVESEIVRRKDLQNGVPKHKQKMDVMVIIKHGQELPLELKDLLDAAMYEIPSDIVFHMDEPEKDDADGVTLKFGNDKIHYDGDLAPIKKFLDEKHAEIFGDVLKPLDAKVDGQEKKFRDFCNQTWAEHANDGKIEEDAKQEKIQNSATWKMNGFDAEALPLID